jgi:hypothetical protein
MPISHVNLSRHELTVKVETLWTCPVRRDSTVAIGWICLKRAEHVAWMATVKFINNFRLKIQKSPGYERKSWRNSLWCGVWNKLSHDFSTGHLLSFIKLQVSYKAGAYFTRWSIILSQTSLLHAVTWPIRLSEKFHNIIVPHIRSEGFAYRGADFLSSVLK